MTLWERASLAGVSLRSVLNHTIVSRSDREMRQAIAELHKTASVELQQSIAGRDRALDMLAGDR